MKTDCFLVFKGKQETMMTSNLPTSPMRKSSSMSHSRLEVKKR